MGPFFSDRVLRERMGDQKIKIGYIEKIRKFEIRRFFTSYVLCQESLLRNNMSYILFPREK